MYFTIKTIGCKVNTYESNVIKTELIKAGLVFIDVKKKSEYEKLDFYIINTCSVTSIADKKSRQMIHQARRLNNRMKIIATGCYVDSHVLDIDKEIDIFIKNKDKLSLSDIVLEYIKKYDIGTTDKEETGIRNSRASESRVREFIKIQDGCNQYCTYCIIPYLRGNIRSRNDDEIVDEIKEKIEKGVKEIVLTGIHLSSFGLDRHNTNYESEGAIDIARNSLLDVIDKIADVKCQDKEIIRIRLGSLEPRIINEGFIKRLIEGKAKNKFCANFCLSLQSGCDKTLKAMNRHYTTLDFTFACDTIRKYIPYATITTDVIVGFPDETIADYEESLAFVKKMRFYNPNIFPYSRRAGTKAAEYDNQVTREEKHRRAAKMIDECEKITKEIEDEYNKIGHEILVEEEIVKNGKRYQVGYTKEYIKRYIEI